MTSQRLFVTGLYKYCRDSKKLKQPPIEQIWSKCKPREVKEPKVWWLEVVHSSRYAVKALPPQQYVRTFVGKVLIHLVMQDATITTYSIILNEPLFQSIKPKLWFPW